MTKAAKATKAVQPCSYSISVRAGATDVVVDARSVSLSPSQAMQLARNIRKAAQAARNNITWSDLSQKQDKAMHMRKMGMSLATIAEALDSNVKTVSRWVQIAEDRAGREHDFYMEAKD